MRCDDAHMDCPAGRNGGHLTPHAYGEFRSQELLYGTDEALRHVAIEQYTVSEVVKILKGANKTDHVDLVSGGRVILFFTAQQYDEARKDFEAAQQAGIVMNGVEWFTKAQVQEVQSGPVLLRLCSDNSRTAIRLDAPRCGYSG